MDLAKIVHLKNYSPNLVTSFRYFASQIKKLDYFELTLSLNSVDYPIVGNFCMRCLGPRAIPTFALLL